MFYGKLPIMFLSEIVSCRRDSISGHLAAYILDHLDEIKHSSIRDLAAQTHTSPSSISRFCREIGLRDFAELKELIMSTTLKFEICSHAQSLQEQRDVYVAAVQDSLNRVCQSVDMEKLHQLAYDIRDYSNVATFGMLKAETVAMNLQSDLTMLGKPCVTKLRMAEQADFLATATVSDLIIIFSYTGIYFDYGMPQNRDRPKSQRPKIYFITSDPEARRSKLYDEVIWFDSQQNQASHPYQLQLIGSLTAQCYAHILQPLEQAGTVKD